MLRAWFVVACVLVSQISFAAFDHTHAKWGDWLKSHAKVTGPVTTVDYAKAKSDPSGLDTYLKTVEGVTKAEYDAFAEKDRLAFLINAYNAETVKWIVKNYPVKSIKDTAGFLSSPWKKKFFKLFGQDQTLDGIEHGMIRVWFQEPRIHFAVVCASKGCPALRGEPFVGSKLEAQLEAGARSFLSDAERNRYDASENRFFVSKIFDWYGDDFKKGGATVQAFLSARMASAPDQVEKMKTASVKFLDYDWNLNETVMPLATSVGQ